MKLTPKRQHGRTEVQLDRSVRLDLELYRQEMSVEAGCTVTLTYAANAMLAAYMASDREFRRRKSRRA